MSRLDCKCQVMQQGIHYVRRLNTCNSTTRLIPSPTLLPSWHSFGYSSLIELMTFRKTQIALHSRSGQVQTGGRMARSKTSLVPQSLGLKPPTSDYRKASRPTIHGRGSPCFSIPARSMSSPIHAPRVSQLPLHYLAVGSAYQGVCQQPSQVAHAQAPNPSIERTLSGLRPPSVSYVKR